MTAMLVAMAVMISAAPADALATVRVKNLSLKAPAAWKQSTEEGTAKFTAPSGDAYFLVDVGTVRRGITPDVCVKKITSAIGGEWEPRTAGGQPAAMRRDVDGKGGEADKVLTLTFVGCDGQVTWSVTFHTVQSKQQRYAELAQRIADSVTYTGQQ